MDIFQLFLQAPPVPRHRRTNTDNIVPAPAPARRRIVPDNIVHLAGRTWQRSEEVQDNTAHVYVLDATDTNTATQYSAAIDQYDLQQIDVQNLKDDLYCTLKQVWATGIGYRAAGDDHRVKNLSHAGERTRAKYWAAMNAAQRLR